MRIVSQCGMKDIPYDDKEVRVADYDKNLYSIVVGMYVVGDYSSKEKALKVMEMIREANNICILQNYKKEAPSMSNGYLFPNDYFYMPQDDEVE